MEPREFFETLETRVDPSKTAGMNNSYVFDVEGAGIWQVDVNADGVKVTEGGTDGDVTIRTSEETFRAVECLDCFFFLFRIANHTDINTSVAIIVAQRNIGDVAQGHSRVMHFLEYDLRKLFFQQI